MDDSLWDNLPTDDALSTHGAAKKGRDISQAPVRQQMGKGIKPADRKHPTGDQKKFRRAQTRKQGNFDPENPEACPECGWDEAYPDEHGRDQQQCTYCGTVYQPGTGHVVSSISGKTSTAIHPAKEASMTSNDQRPTEAELLTRLAAATTFTEQVEISGQIETLRAGARESKAELDSLDWGAMSAPSTNWSDHLGAHLTPVHEGSLHIGNGLTEATDWLDDILPTHTADADLSVAMRAQATQWYEHDVYPPVKADPSEFSVQSSNAAVRAGAAYGLQREAAASVFLDQVRHLASRDGIPLQTTSEWGTDSMRPGPDPTVPTYVSDGRDSLPVGVDPAKAETHDDGPDSTGKDPKTKTDAGVQQSLSEGSPPEGDHSESSENPLTGDTSLDKSTYDTGKPTDRMNTQSAYGRCNHTNAQGEHCIRPEEHEAGKHLFESDVSVKPRGRVQSHLAAGYGGGSPKEGDTAKCHKDDGNIQFFDGMWMHLNDGTGSDHNDVYPATPKEQADKDKASKSSAHTAGSVNDLTGMGTCSVCGDSIAKDPRGENPSTWHHDNGSKHDHEAKPGGGSSDNKAASRVDIDTQLAEIFSPMFGSGIETYSQQRRADVLRSDRGLGEGINEGDSPEGDHSESPTQEPGQGANDASTGTEGDRPDGGINWGAGGGAAKDQTGAYTSSLVTAGDDEGPTPADRPCDHYEEHPNYKNVCKNCWWSAGGHKKTSSLSGSLTASLSPNARVFVETLRRMSSLDEEIDGISGRQVATLLSKDPTCPPNLREALRGGDNPFGAAGDQTRRVVAVSDECKRCHVQIHRDEQGTWIDNSGGDICEDDKPHVPHYDETKEAARTGPTIDEPKGVKYTPAPEWVAKACRRRFEGGGTTAVHPTKKGWYLHGVENFWDGPSEVKDNGDGTLSYTSPYSGETDVFDETGYNPSSKYHPNNAKTSAEAPKRVRKTLPNGTEVWEVTNSDGSSHVYPVSSAGDTANTADDDFRPVGSKQAAGTAKPGEVKHIDNGAYQRSTCQNCGTGIRRKNQMSSGWTHARTNTKFCPDSKTSGLLASVVANGEYPKTVTEECSDPSCLYYGMSHQHEVTYANEDAEKAQKNHRNKSGLLSSVVANIDRVTAAPRGNSFSISDAKNEEGEWTMSPEQIRSEMAYDPHEDPYAEDDYYEASLRRIAAEGPRPLYEIAEEIRRVWRPVFYGAVPYLEAMGQLSSMDDKFYEDSARTVVAYFLSNTKTWKGDDARRIKAELRAMQAKRASLQQTAGIRGPADRSVMFTCLLNLSPEFGRMETRAGSDVVSEALEAWYAHDGTDMYAFTQQWLASNPIT